MPTQLSNAYAKERSAYYHDKKHPLQKIIMLMNQYWSIDVMFATAEEKTWAKNRLEYQIKGLMKHVGTAVHGRLKASFKSKATWVETRTYLS